ncbi:MAG: DNA-methyltransferase [Thermacetogeniaceae bacterium]|jgi:DNA modification methylase
MLNKIIHGDCLTVMKDMPDNSIDSIVTDPPYELGFMGKAWDSTGIAYNVNMWKECLRVLKPGGHLLAFGGSRTYHRMACAIEDAGFEIRDQIMWITGQGFPKSMDISKAIDKKQGITRPLSNIQRPIGGKDGVYEGQGGNWGETVKIPQSKKAIQWDGWGTALKPAHEPIVVARKPLSEKTVADNVLKWGTGGINIDGCRVETNRETPKGSGKGSKNSIFGQVANSKGNDGNVTPELGRFPANLILDEEAGKLLDEQSGITKSVVRISEDKDNPANTYSLGRKGVTPRGHNDSGGASRFFYCAKASKKERGESNTHPTVKPLALMRYLVRLVTPPDGTVLDPFAGSGSTLVASMLEGFNFVGIEREQKYVDIANQRIAERMRL